MTIPDPMTGERLADIKDRLAVLPEGPWFVEDCEGNLRIWREGALHSVRRNEHGEITGYRLPVSIGPDNLIAEWDLDTWDPGDDDGDDLRRDIARFIGAAREDVPALLAEVERLRSENARLKARVPSLDCSDCGERSVSIVHTCNVTAINDAERAFLSAEWAREAEKAGGFGD